MPTNRVRRSRQQIHLDPYCRQQLLKGPNASILAGVGYLTAAAFEEMSADDQAQVLASMERDWRTHRDELMQWRNQGEAASHAGFKPWIFVVPEGPDSPPWAARQFDNGETK